MQKSMSCVSKSIGLLMRTISYDVIATKNVSTLLPNNIMFFIVKIIMKIISSDITQYFEIIIKPLYMFHKLHVVADIFNRQLFY